MAASPGSGTARGRRVRPRGGRGEWRGGFGGGPGPPGGGPGEKNSFDRQRGGTAPRNTGGGAALRRRLTVAGESGEADRRVIIAGPLSVKFRVLEDQRRVEVISASYSRGKRP